jgi:hypothetical protein
MDHLFMLDLSDDVRGKPLQQEIQMLSELQYLIKIIPCESKATTIEYCCDASTRLPDRQIVPPALA